MSTYRYTYIYIYIMCIRTYVYIYIPYNWVIILNPSPSSDRASFRIKSQQCRACQPQQTRGIGPVLHQTMASLATEAAKVATATVSDDCDVLWHRKGCLGLLENHGSNVIGRLAGICVHFLMFRTAVADASERPAVFPRGLCLIKSMV